jgi:glycerol dehydrogenase-like iron-containing ADH family enzyme
MSAEIEEIKKIMEDAEWDIKADDLELARTKLNRAKDIAKKIRNEELLKKILELRKKTYRSMVL